MKFQKSPAPFMAVLLFLVVAVPIMDYKARLKGHIEIKIDNRQNIVRYIDQSPNEIVMNKDMIIAGLNK